MVENLQSWEGCNAKLVYLNKQMDPVSWSKAIQKCLQVFMDHMMQVLSLESGPKHIFLCILWLHTPTTDCLLVFIKQA